MIIKANSLQIPLKDKSVQAIITSPPYWGLRKYDIMDTIFDITMDCSHNWTEYSRSNNSGNPTKNTIGNNNKKGLSKIKGYLAHQCSKCGAWRGQLGLEPTIELYLTHLMQIMNECWRVLKDDGVCFVNLGDTYAGSYMGQDGKHMYLKNNLKQKGRCPQSKIKEIKNKSLCCISERFVLACLDAGWILRNKIIWHKTNAMPSSVKDRFSVQWEQIYMLTKQGKYYFDLDSVREKQKSNYKPFNLRVRDAGKKHMESSQYRATDTEIIKYKNNPNRQSAHRNYQGPNPKGKNPGDVWKISTAAYPNAHYSIFPPKLVERMLLCSTKIGDVVLDPFGGSGTTGKVALEYSRYPVLLDLGYQELQVERLKEVKQQRLI